MKKIKTLSVRLSSFFESEIKSGILERYFSLLPTTKPFN